MIHINNILNFFNLHNMCIAMLLFPLSSALIIGFFGKYFRCLAINIISIFCITVNTIIDSYFLWKFFIDDYQNINTT